MIILTNDINNHYPKFLENFEIELKSLGFFKPYFMSIKSIL